ncbi:MAG: ferredoxin-thioredoxin reductase catalytic domain-containing protein [Candidatus Xenobiia bacterium LiM19]
MKAYERNLERIEGIAREKDLFLNPDVERVKRVVRLMAENFTRAGEYVCPCKQSNWPPLKGREVLCPCPDMDDEIEKDGHCHCSLFFKTKQVLH